MNDDELLAFYIGYIMGYQKSMDYTEEMLYYAAEHLDTVNDIIYSKEFKDYFEK